MLSRRGATLAELIVAMVMLGIIGAATAGALTQQERVRSRIAVRLAAEAQLREAVAPVMADLGAASPAAGDFDGAPPRDTMFELRATIGEGYACGIDPSDARGLIVRPLGRLRNRTPAAGDVAWGYHAPGWASATVDGVSAASASAPGCAASDAESGLPFRIALASPIVLVAGSPLRFTRRLRYNLYLAGDGQTYLGLREWSVVTGTFAGVQPVAGPFDAEASRFLYYDSLGTELPSGAASGHMLASVTLLLVGARYPGAPAAAATPQVTVRVALRNRP